MVSGIADCHSFIGQMWLGTVTIFVMEQGLTMMNYMLLQFGQVLLLQIE
jgi:hypothetical protein